jgi:predicted nucleic acid-binding protein
MKTTGKKARSVKTAAAQMPLFYLDACVILAWIKNEKRPNPADMDGLQRVIQALDAGEIRICTSVITHIEALPEDMDDKARGVYEAIFARPAYIHQEGVTGAIAKLARTIRNETKKLPHTVSTPDAIHVATAIVLEANTFLTFDGTSTKEKKKKLIPLSGKAAVEGLVIRPPDYTPPAPAQDEKQPNLFESLASDVAEPLTAPPLSLPPPSPPDAES